MSLIGRWLVGWLLVTTPVVVWGWATLWPVVRQFGDPDRPRSFYVPGKSMLPTLAAGDHLRPRLVGATPVRRGMVIVFKSSDGMRVDRIAGLTGDVVAMRGGRLWLNGKPVMVTPDGPGPDLDDGAHSRLLREQLPGELGHHRILDAGESVDDDYGPARVPAGDLFVLGDNRDRAADSRFGPEIGGVGMVPVSAVLGIADRLLWGHSRRDLGRTLDGEPR